MAKVDYNYVQPAYEGIANITNRTSTTNARKDFLTIDNYIYLYHTKTLISLQTFPDSIQDSINVNFNSYQPLARTAPIFSYVNSGPRSMQFTLKLHRDMFSEIYYLDSTLNVRENDNSLTNLNDDYIETIIKEIQSAALPRYNSSEKMVDPPIVAVRFGNDIYCRGIVDGSVGVTYSGPILTNNKYACVDLNFGVKEIEPYDAESIMLYGGFRGFSTDLERNIYKNTNTGSTALGYASRNNVTTIR